MGTDGPVYYEEGHSIAICGNAVITYSTEPPSRSYLSAWQRITARVATRSNDSVVVMIIIPSGTRAPDDSARKTIKDTVNLHKSQIVAFAYIVEGQGFQATAIRSMLSLISLAARYPFPQQIFANVDDAARWVAELVPEASADNIVHCTAWMRGDASHAAVS